MNQQNMPPYVQPPVATMMPQTSTTAIISLVAGIASYVILPFLGAIVAIITGHMAKSEIKKSMGRLSGNGMATAGLILGYVNIGLGLCALCVFVILPLLGLGLSIPFMNSTTH